MVRLLALFALLMLPFAGCGTPSQADAAAVETVAVEVPGMVCDAGCPPVVQKTLAQQPGVASVEVDFETKTATCKLQEGAQFDSAAAVAALDQAGFAESKVKAE